MVAVAIIVCVEGERGVRGEPPTNHQPLLSYHMERCDWWNNNGLVWSYRHTRYLSNYKLTNHKRVLDVPLMRRHSETP